MVKIQKRMIKIKITTTTTTKKLSMKLKHKNVLVNILRRNKTQKLPTIK